MAIPIIPIIVAFLMVLFGVGVIWAIYVIIEGLRLFATIATAIFSFFVFKDYLIKAYSKLLTELNSISEKLLYWERALLKDFFNLVDVFSGKMSSIEAEKTIIDDMSLRSFSQTKEELNSIYEKEINYFLTSQEDSFTLNDYLSKDTIVHVYDYSKNIGVDRWAYKGYGDYNPPASSVLLDEVEFSAEDYDYLSSEDGYNAIYNEPTAYDYGGHRFFIKVEEPSSQVSSIIIHWRGYGSGYYGNGADLYIWDYINSSWLLLGSHGKNINTDIDGTITTSISNYFSPNNEINIVAEASDFAGPGPKNVSRIASDYIKVTIYK